VLVVEDNPDQATLLAKLLGIWGHRVQVAHDGPEAIEAVRAQAPEVVLVDIGLPGMSGYELARALRKQPGLKEALLMAVSGYGQDEDRRRSREAGFDQHLVKPVDPPTLKRLIASSGGKLLS
jgi:two-component system CheB/CheR fusion protein